MLRKILSLVFLLSFFITLFASSYGKAIATDSGCRITTKPSYISTENKAFEVTIYPSDGFSFGEYYYLDIHDAGSVIERRIFAFQGDGTNPIKMNVVTPRGSPLGKATIEVFKLPSIFDIFGQIRTVTGGSICKYETIIGYNPDCIIKPFINNEGIGFKVSDLRAETEGVKRGLVSRSNNGTLGINICLTEQELTNGYFVANKISDKDKMGPDGIYQVRLSQGCTVFNTADGSNFCKAPDGKVYVEFGVSKNHGFSATGIECNYKTNDEYQKNEDCNKDGIAPFCNKDSRSTKGGFCAKIPDITEKCQTENGKTTCNTAIGNIPTDPDSFVRRFLSLVLGVAGGLLLIYLIINGYRLMTSQGDPEKIKEARESITAAIVGLLFIIFSIFILQFIIKDILQIPGLQ